MSDDLILSLLLAISLVTVVVLYFKYKSEEVAAQIHSENCADLQTQLLQANKELNAATQALDFNKACLMELGKRDIACMLNDAQAAQLIQTVAQIVTQTKQGVVN